MTPRALYPRGRVVLEAASPSDDPFDALHDRGVPLVLLDARALPRWRGATLSERWVVWRDAPPHARLDPWPEASAVFGSREAAQQAWLALRRHLATRLPGVTARDARGELPAIVARDAAWAEVYSHDGADVAALVCDRTTDALTLAALARPAVTFDLGGLRCVGHRAPCETAQVAFDAASPPALAALVASPIDESATLAEALPGDWLDHPADTLTLDVPSGVLVALWGRVDGASLFTTTAGGDPAAMVDHFLGARPVAVLPTGLERVARGPTALCARVRPGSYTFARFSRGRPSPAAECVALSHADAPPFRPGAVASRVASLLPAPDDPEVFPGEALPRLSDHAGLVLALREAPLWRVLDAHGLDAQTFTRASLRWSHHIQRTPALNERFAALLAARSPLRG